MNDVEILSIEKYRSDIYKAFSRYYRTPSRSSGDQLRLLEYGLCTIGSRAISQVALMRSELSSGITIKDIEIEFAKLFIGPYQLLAPPYGSVYLDGERQIMGDSTLDVVKRYRAAGLTVDEGFNNPPDHISAEMEFMHVLIIEELNCIRKGLADEAAESLAQQFAFLESHLGQWIDAFTGFVVQETQMPYFRHLAAATQQFVSEDMRRLGETVADLNTRSETTST